jgi:hypothetical protein
MISFPARACCRASSAGRARIGLHQSSHRLTARAIMMTAAIMTNPVKTSNGVTVMIAHRA